jgi:hypothetical protein
VRAADDATVIHEGIPVAVHAQPLLVAIVKVLLFPAAFTETLAGETVNAHVPACVTVNVWPAIVTDPVRSLVAVLAATRIVAVPLPEPLAPDVTEIHDVPLVADHEQPVPAVTATVVVSPAATIVLLAGVIP